MVEKAEQLLTDSFFKAKFKRGDLFMKWENINKDMVLSPTGMGIVFYSEGAVRDIPIGKDYLNEEYWDGQKVGDHIRKGDIVSICTGCDSEEYELRFRSGYPDDEIVEKYPAHLRLFIEIIGNEMNVIDLYDLMDWQDNCPREQQIDLEPGIYHLTFCGEEPGFARLRGLSDEEHDELMDELMEKPNVIYVHINKLETRPESHWKGGVPYFYWAYEEK